MKNKNNISEKAYEKYQLDWIITHGYSLQNIFDIFKEGYIEGCENGNIDDGTSCKDDFNYIKKYFEEHGFKGNIFVSYNEFLNYEYKDMKYMKSLLNEQEFINYLEDIMFIQRGNDNYD